MIQSVKEQSEIGKAMPLLLRHEGVWEGWYRYYDAKTGVQVDAHRSRLLCRLPDDGPFPYHQTNYYFWNDGRTDTRDFAAAYRDGRIWWDNELIAGWCSTLRPDDTNRSMCLYWVRKGESNLELYEMIQLSDDGKNRARTWQWFDKGVCVQRTLIDERFVTRDWRTWKDLSAPKTEL